MEGLRTFSSGRDAFVYGTGDADHVVMHRVGDPLFKIGRKKVTATKTG